MANYVSVESQKMRQTWFVEVRVERAWETKKNNKDLKKLTSLELVEVNG